MSTDECPETTNQCPKANQLGVLQNIHVSKLCVDLTTGLWTQSAVTACSKMQQVQHYHLMLTAKASLTKEGIRNAFEKPSAPKR
jgi:hypothetical protein